MHCLLNAALLLIVCCVRCIVCEKGWQLMRCIVCTACTVCFYAMHCLHAMLYALHSLLHLCAALSALVVCCMRCFVLRCALCAAGGLLGASWGPPGTNWLAGLGWAGLRHAVLHCAARLVLAEHVLVHG